MLAESGAAPDLTAYVHGFAIALGCNLALLVLGGVLSLRLSRQP